MYRRRAAFSSACVYMPSKGRLRTQHVRVALKKLKTDLGHFINWQPKQSTVDIINFNKMVKMQCTSV